MNPSREVDPRTVDAVDRTIRLLEHLARHPDGIGVVRLADELHLAPSTVHRYLATLQERHVVEQGPEKRYRLTARLYLLGLAAGDRLDLAAQAQTTLERVAERSRETVCLMVRDDLHAVCVAQVDSHQHLKIAARVGSRQDLRVGATSRVLLAYAPADVRDRALGAPPIRATTPDTVTDPDAIRAILMRIRRDGHYVSSGEIDTGVVAVAAPVRDRREEVIASLVIAAPEPRARGAALDGLIELAARGAAEISRRLGSTRSLRSPENEAPGTTPPGPALPERTLA